MTGSFTTVPRPAGLTLMIEVKIRFFKPFSELPQRCLLLSPRAFGLIIGVHKRE